MNVKRKRNRLTHILDIFINMSIIYHKYVYKSSVPFNGVQLFI